MSWDAGVMIAALALAITAFGIAVRYGSSMQAIRSDIYYIKRDIDQILKLYRLTPVAEQERRRGK